MTQELNEAEQTLFEYLQSKGCTLKVGEIIDFQLIGNETDHKIMEYANDFLSECASDEAEYRAHKKAGNYYD